LEFFNKLFYFITVAAKRAKLMMKIKHFQVGGLKGIPNILKGAAFSIVCSENISVLKEYIFKIH
jgi:hypothetical protein